jgi:hypothetical protein
MGMRTIIYDIPHRLITLVETLRARLRDADFLGRHRVRPEDFTRHRQLTFPVIMLFTLQKTVKSIQNHLHEFLDQLADGQLFRPVTPGAWTKARAKLKHSAFIELNRDCLLPLVYDAAPSEGIQRWRGHRLLGIDSSLTRLPCHEEVGKAFGWVEVTNQKGRTGTRYPEGRISVVYDVLNRLGLDARLESSRRGEVALALEQVAQLQPEDIAINDRGFSGYIYWASVCQQGAHFIGRCSTGSFLAAQEMFRRNRANQSQVVWLFAPADQKAECQRLGLPLQMKVRFVSVRLPTGELEVLATSLLEAESYPTEEFLTVYHWRWGHETFHLMLKGRLDLENFSGETPEAVRQDFFAAVLVANLESVLSQPVQSALNQRHDPEVHPRQVNHSVCYHALKDQVLDLLYRDLPAPQVLAKLMRFFQGSPVVARPKRQGPERAKKMSYNRSYHFQRRVKKIVF